MSDLILPPGIRLPEPIKAQDEPEKTAPPEQKATMLPEPKGWKLLCIVPEIEEKFEGSSIIKADSYMKKEEHGTTVLFVLKVGDLAYKDTEKFPTGPWCKEGDFVLVRTYSGTRFKVYGKEFRILNDDQVEAVVQDPRGLSRAA
jgi:co-chaperonin GroES (HSP10)